MELNRRLFLSAATATGIGLLNSGCASHGESSSACAHASDVANSTLKILPYPQEVTPLEGFAPLGRPEYTVASESPTIQIAKQSLNSHLPSHSPRTLRVRLGSVEEGYDRRWLADAENEWLAATSTGEQASVLHIDRRGITVVGKGNAGMLYGAQTVNQLIRQATAENKNSLPCLTIRDWPDMPWRCLAPTLTWYSGWNRLEGYDICNWSEGEWKWLADWSLLHKCNAWAVCMYGYWPFKLPVYEQETLDVESNWFNPATNRREKHRFIHRNIRQEFFPKVIEYANQRGVQVHAYIGKNSFNGKAFSSDPARYSGGAAEMLPFAPGVEEYWDAFIGRLLELGFNGFVFEDPEANHVPNQNVQCWETFWKPWAAKYGFKTVHDTNQNAPPLGVHIEYYTWLFRTFDRLIQKHAERLGRKTEIYLISHVLLARIVSESKTEQERQHWLAMVDEKHGRKVPFVIVENNEKSYVQMFGGDRIASLGGRGGSCTCAMRRIASVNNDWCQGAMGADLAYERDCQKHIFEAGGFGAMGYIFEWTNTEVFAYLAAQHLWRNRGIPSVSNTDQVGILYHAYQLYYGEEVGTLVARAMDEGSCVNDAMVLEGVYGSQYPFTGKALHRDYQLLAVLADHAEQLARQAYKLYTGSEPELYQSTYDQDGFSWNGYDSSKDRLFKTERLRLLWVSARRSQQMCQAALAHRMAQRMIAEGRPQWDVLKQYDRAIAAATLNQRMYQLNYDDDYDATDGLCARVTEVLQQQRDHYVHDANHKPEPPVLFIPWESQGDVQPMLLPMVSTPRNAISPGELRLRAEIGCLGEDFFRLGVAFTIQLQLPSGQWQTIFRRTVHRRDRGWQSWDIPLPGMYRSPRVRFITDSYSRAQDRTAPTWKWAAWRKPQLVRDTNVIFDFVQQIHSAKRLVCLDSDGKERAFDQGDTDSSGACFQLLDPAETISAFTPHLQSHFGITIAEYEIKI